MSSLVDRINSLRKAKNAVILAHTYQSGEVQNLADFVGDSYGLSVKATQLEQAELIVFCGVSFMAETASILNPGKKVVMPDATAGCAMADMISAEQLRAMKRQHPRAKVVCYVNSTTEVKAESDVCCTSSNAVRIVEKLGSDTEIIFVPDRNLGRFVENQLNRKLILCDGFCPVHDQLNEALILDVQGKYPGVPLMVHPETRPEVQRHAQHILATGDMLKLVKNSPESKFIVGTEQGIMHALQQATPEKEFFHLSPCLVCEDMKKTTLQGILNALETEETAITVPEAIAKQARRSIEEMLRLA